MQKECAADNRKYINFALKFSIILTVLLPRILSATAACYSNMRHTLIPFASNANRFTFFKLIIV